MLDLHDGKYNL